jgi:hypothetical protein
MFFIQSYKSYKCIFIIETFCSNYDDFYFKIRLIIKRMFSVKTKKQKKNTLIRMSVLIKQNMFFL